MKKPMRSVAIKSCLFGLSCLLLASCGYGFAPQGEHIDRRISNIYVEPFGNKTAEPEIENYIRTAFIDQIILGKRFHPVPTLEQADAVISGNVLNITTGTLSYRNTVLAAEERMYVTLEASLREKASGKIIWSSRNVTGTTDYKLQDDVNPRPARRSAMSKLAKDTVENAYNMMMSDF